MNELKPEDVMRALECCAGTFTCNKCPRKNDEYHCVKNLVRDALALLREKDAEIERSRAIPEQLYKEMSERMVEERKIERKLAITEFAERIEKSLTAQVNASSNEMLAAFMWCLALVKNVEKQLKGETDGESDL